MLDQLIYSDLSRELITVLMAMLPVAELRLGLPVAITVFEMPWYKAYYLSVTGNLIPVPFLLLFFEGVSRLFQRTKIGERFITWLLNLTARRARMIGKYRYLGLIAFVSIPLPITGAWTGSLASYILGFRFWPAFASIALGVMFAGVIVTILTLLGWIGAAIAAIGIILLLTLSIWKL